jgi:hypothetical protein
LFRNLIECAPSEQEKRDGQGKSETNHQRDKTDAKRPLLSVRVEHKWRTSNVAIPSKPPEMSAGVWSQQSGFEGKELSVLLALKEKWHGRNY